MASAEPGSPLRDPRSLGWLTRCSLCLSHLHTAVRQALESKEQICCLMAGSSGSRLFRAGPTHHLCGLSAAMLLWNSSSPQGLCTCHSLLLECHLPRWHCSLLLTIWGELTSVGCFCPPAHHIMPQSLSPSQHTWGLTPPAPVTCLLGQRRYRKSGDLVCLTRGLFPAPGRAQRPPHSLLAIQPLESLQAPIGEG